MTSSKKKDFDAIALHADDSVATLIHSLQAGTTIFVHHPGGVRDLLVHDKIALGHKVAIRKIEAGEPVLKNGQVIGRATQHIAVGHHVHTHNLAGKNSAEYLA